MFWDIFYDLCKKVDKSPNAVVKELGMSTATATNWKTSGRTPNGDTLRLVADYFDVSVDYLLGRVDSPAVSEVPVALSSPQGYDDLTDEQKELIQSLIDQYNQKNSRS